MSLDSRNSSAYLKRAEQLKRWAESETSRQPITPKNDKPKIKFSSGCIFLAACVAGDKDEVKALLQEGADINTANIDGLTALHQVCTHFYTETKLCPTFSTKKNFTFSEFVS